MANKVMTELYNTNEADIVGKTDHDFLGNPIKYKRDADRYAKRTVDVVNKGKEMVIEADPLTLTNGKTLYFNKVKMPINIRQTSRFTMSPYN